MKVQITLNVGVPFWFLPSGALHLSEETPGPVEIDFSLMSKEEQKLIILGSRNHQITTSEHDAALVAFFSKDASPPPIAAQHVAVAVEEEEAPPVLINTEDALIAQASVILNKSNTTIKKEMGLSDDIRLVRVMLELEKQNKNRKAIVALLESRLTFFANKIQDTIKSEDAPAAKVDSLDPLAAAMEIVDSEVEERKIDLD